MSCELANNSTDPLALLIQCGRSLWFVVAYLPNVYALKEVMNDMSESGKDALPTSVSIWATIWMLACREWKRFFRQRNRVIGGLGQPILFWLLFGTGMHQSFQGSGDQSFMTYFLPGTIALILLFTAIFTTISIIEDRKEGFLQTVLVAPPPRYCIAAGKILGGGMIAFVQGGLFLLLALLVGTVSCSSSIGGAVLLMAVGALGITALGVLFAWPMNSTQGFHAIMNLVLMPLWLLSGAFFPIPTMGPDSPVGQHIMHWVMRCNPMTYLVSSLRGLLHPGLTDSSAGWQPNLVVAISMTIVFCALGCILAFWRVQKATRGDLHV